MWRWNKAVGFIFGAALTFVASAAPQSSPKFSKLTIEQLIEIKHPSNPVWSPDGKHVVFTWDRAGVANLYVASADGHGQPQALTLFPEGQVEGAFWNEDGDTLYFPRDGDLWQVPVTGSTPKRVWSKLDRGRDFVPSPNASASRSFEAIRRALKAHSREAISSSAGSPTEPSPRSPTTMSASATSFGPPTAHPSLTPADRKSSITTIPQHTPVGRSSIASQNMCGVKCMRCGSRSANLSPSASPASMEA